MKIVTPVGQAYEGEVQKASFPGAVGRFTVLPRHAPMISLLAQGDISYWPVSGGSKRATVEGGFVEIRNNEILVAAEGFNKKDE